MIIRVSNYVQLSKKHVKFFYVKFYLLVITHIHDIWIYIYIYISILENCEFFQIDFLSKLVNFIF